MDLLSMAQLALNSRPNSAIGGMSLFFLRHGYDLNPIAEPTSSGEIASRRPGQICARNYVERLRVAQEFAQVAIASAQQRNGNNANRLRRQPERFKVGHKVRLDL